MEKVFITWKIFDRLVDQIVEHYKDVPLDEIIGLSRGGLPLAVALSNRLEVPLTVIKWQTRDGQIQETSKLHEYAGKVQVRKLWVDDIYDSGKTIEAIKEIVPKSKWCTLITKKRGAVEYSPIYLTGGKWIIFPWEKQ